MKRMLLTIALLSATGLAYSGEFDNPAAAMRRRSELQQKLRAGTITPEEHAQLQELLKAFPIRAI